MGGMINENKKSFNGCHNDSRFFYAQMFLYQKLILVMNMLKMIIEDNQ